MEIAKRKKNVSDSNADRKILIKRGNRDILFFLSFSLLCVCVREREKKKRERVSDFVRVGVCVSEK